MGSVFQSAVLPSLLAAPTLATRCVLIWTTTDAARAVIATGNVEAQNLKLCLSTAWSNYILSSLSFAHVLEIESMYLINTLESKRSNGLSLY